MQKEEEIEQSDKILTRKPRMQTCTKTAAKQKEEQKGNWYDAVCQYRSSVQTLESFVSFFILGLPSAPLHEK